jgi:hypothetical protein
MFSGGDQQPGRAAGKPLIDRGQAPTPGAQLAVLRGREPQYSATTNISAPMQSVSPTVWK